MFPASLKFRTIVFLASLQEIARRLNKNRLDEARPISQWFNSSVVYDRDPRGIAGKPTLPGD
ncbi:MAG: hypothetical protein RLZZ337_1389 [Bacteroidota bacterium]|jgi:PIN domain nuclease of toxin-antitoxin system